MTSDPSFREGLNVRREWLRRVHRTVGSCCRIAYVKSVPVGMIQFNPLHRIPYFVTKRRDALYIHCIFVKKKFREQGIGFKLLQNLVDEMREPNPYFDGQPCRVFVTTARQRQAFRQPSYFRLKGFSETAGNIDAGLVYWLSEEKPRESLDVRNAGPIQVAERGVTIFFDRAVNGASTSTRPLGSASASSSPTHLSKSLIFGGIRMRLLDEESPAAQHTSTEDPYSSWKRNSSGRT